MLTSCLAQKPDSQGRIQIPKKLMDNQTTISPKVAICFTENYLYLRSINDVSDCQIFDIRHMDAKNRLILPKSIIENFSKFLIYLYNGEIRIKGVP